MMEQDNTNIYKQYIETIDLLLKIPAELKSTIDLVQKDAAQSGQALQNEMREQAERYSKLRMSAESEYSKIHQVLAEIDVSIPARKRATCSNVNMTLAQAFESKKKVADNILRLVANIRSQRKQADSASHSASEALNRRRLLVQQKLDAEKKQLCLEEEEKRKREEEAKLRAKIKRKFSFNIGDFTVTIDKKDESEKMD